MSYNKLKNRIMKIWREKDKKEVEEILEEIINSKYEYNEYRK